mgnify:CR=1 FL=1
MLKSLFGELVPTALKPGGPMPEFAATAVLESTDTRVADDGRMLDRHQQDLFFSGSPAAAMREHMAQARHADDVAHRLADIEAMFHGARVQNDVEGSDQVRGHRLVQIDNALGAA